MEPSKESGQRILFHGSKDGLSEVTSAGSRSSCDFGPGFYLGESYGQALSFVCGNDGSSVYSFQCDLDGLSVKRFSCDLEWMLAICYYRGQLGEYGSSPMVRSVASEVDAADVVVAPIADNKMFYVMTQFAEGDINVDVALHFLSASRLGQQYVAKTDKAVKQLTPIGRY